MDLSDHHDSGNLMRYRSTPSTLLTSQIAESASEDGPSSTESDFSRFFSSEFRRSDAGGEKEGFRSMLYGWTPGCTGNPTPLAGSVDAGAMQTNGGMLLRHSSSPAGLFAHLTANNAFSTTKAGTSRSISSSGLSLSRIPELGRDDAAASGSDTGGFLNGFRVSSWEDSNLISESFSNQQNSELLVGKPDGKRIHSFVASHSQNGESLRRGGATCLTHQFSLPKTSSEMTEVENFFHFQDSVPCRVRAKRGCATHPRSIAERVRRTRISERMRKLQELVPNMEKQTNTSDMLELAVEHIKDLRRKVQELSDSRSRCTCGSKQGRH